MAIDSSGKRASMLSFGNPALLYYADVPDGSQDDGDRYNLEGLYYGITLLNLITVTLHGKTFWYQARRQGEKAWKSYRDIGKVEFGEEDA